MAMNDDDQHRRDAWMVAGVLLIVLVAVMWSAWHHNRDMRDRISSIERACEDGGYIASRAGYLYTCTLAGKME